MQNWVIVRQGFDAYEKGIKGQLTISNEEGLKITRDWEDKKGLVNDLQASN
ncbi:hypothetical protein [Cytobacillus praedii]|uniref:hypothetical protein n=1 Tax=Cytobacillus praedii TaxID=1742358 RepID=UPI000AF3957B|nr:hypothetical protein [Cytobacillus praedii]